MLRSMLVALVSLALAGPAMAQDKKAEAPAPKAAAKTTKKATKKAEAKKAPAKKATKKAEAKKATKSKKKMAKKETKKEVDLLAELGGFDPQPVRHPDNKGLHAFLKTLEKAKGPEAMADHISFPAYMVTTNKKGEAMAMSADKATYLKTMQMPKTAEAAMKAMHRGHSQITWLSDGIAFVKTHWRMHSGRHWYHWETGMLLIKDKDGWKIGTMVEPGWGAMGQKSAAAAASTATAQK